jgi:DNA-binding NarL/FixJ family response regulator
MLGTDDIAPPTVTPRLTHRELMIVFLMSAGHTAPEIAELLELRPRTVENYKRHIYEKLGVSSQTHAVAKAIWLRLLTPGRPRALATRAASRPRDSGDPGRAILAVLLGPAGRNRDEVARLLIAERVPLVLVVKREDLTHDHWARWHLGPVVVVLVDPESADWVPAIALGAPAVVVRSRDVPEQLAIADALAHQASGLVSQADVAAGLAPILSVVAQGLLTMSWSYAETLLKWAPSPSPAVPELTARERDILCSIAHGDSIRQTARGLGIAVKTVENTQARLFRKLGVRNRMEALTTADALGLIDRSIAPADQEPRPV